MDISLDCQCHAHLTTSALPSFPTRGHLPQDIEVNRNARPSSRHLLRLREDDETSIQFFRDYGGNEELLRPCSFTVIAPIACASYPRPLYKLSCTLSRYRLRLVADVAAHLREYLGRLMMTSGHCAPQKSHHPLPPSLSSHSQRKTLLLPLQTVYALRGGSNSERKRDYTKSEMQQRPSSAIEDTVNSSSGASYYSNAPSSIRQPCPPRDGDRNGPLFCAT